MTDIDECASNIHDCHQHSECKDTQGAYVCLCRKGFTGHCDACEGNWNCQVIKPWLKSLYFLDIDECLTNTHECSANSECKNTLGSYECICGPGYTGDGKVCTDINECQLGTHKCGQNAECQNLVGSYKCICNAGYSANKEKTACEGKIWNFCYC